MENYKISLQVLQEGSDYSEIGIYAKNTVTLHEYATRTNFQTSYIPRLEKWLQKRRFTIEEEDGLLLQVEIFTF